MSEIDDESTRSGSSRIYSPICLSVGFSEGRMAWRYTSSGRCVLPVGGDVAESISGSVEPDRFFPIGCSRDNGFRILFSAREHNKSKLLSPRPFCSVLQQKKKQLTVGER